MGAKKWTPERRQIANAQKALREVARATENARTALDRATLGLVKARRAFKDRSN